MGLLSMVGVLLAGVSMALAQELPVVDTAGSKRDSMGFVQRMLKNTSANASFRGEFWSSSKSLDDKDGFGVGAVWLKGQSTFSSRLLLKWEGWALNQSIPRSGTVEGELREGYLNFDFDEFSLRLGRQITVWGRADAINPTDNVSSRDYALMVPDENDQRRGNFSAKAAYALGAFNLIGFWLPEFRENSFPLPVLPPSGFAGETETGYGMESVGVQN